jgi:ubiquinone/menaquinone biosynthesis C-methylase UbiE
MRGTTIVDLAGGTGDVTFRILEKLKAQPLQAAGAVDTRVVVCDINAEMLAEGRRRAAVNSVAAEGVSLQWVRGDAEALPFPDGYADRLLQCWFFFPLIPTNTHTSQFDRCLGHFAGPWTR